jgi:polygalacturonase
MSCTRQKSLFIKRSTQFLVFTILVLFPQQFLTCQQSSQFLVPDKISPIVSPFEMAQLKRPDIPSQHFDIRDFGAVDGGLVKNTQAIQTAIENAAKVGGGIVVIPKGKWLTGAIHLEDNINLYLSKGAELLFSQDVNDYLPVVFSRHEDIECYKYSAFIYAEGKKNIAITGDGILNGQGKPWWSYKESKKGVEALLYEMGNKGVPVKERIFDGTDGRELRPAFFQPMNCTNILVEGVTFLYGAFWTITPTYCENVIVRKVRIETEGAYGHTPNGDGVDPSSCRNVLIEDCTFNTGDDCIAIKAGRDNDGLRVNKPTENIVIRNCSGLNGHGGIVVGSETSGSVRNIYAENCSFKGTDRVVRIKTARGRGGIIENMWFKNLVGEEILQQALHLNMLYTGERLPEQPVTKNTPLIRNIHFENIKILSGKGYAIELLGLPEMFIENISFKNINAQAVNGMNVSDARKIVFSNSNIESKTTPVLKLTDVSNISIESVNFSDGNNIQIQVNGAKSQDITLRRTNIHNTEKNIMIDPSVSKQAIRFEE